MKKLLILYSAYTGSGHKSICDSLTEQFARYPDLAVNIVDGFALIGRVGIEASKMYGPMTRNARDLWKFTYLLAQQNTRGMDGTISSLIHDRFMKLLSQDMPDLILTVHPLFNGSVLNILEYYELPIPVVALQADLISIHRAWCDTRAALTLCPTEEAYERSLQCGMPEEKMKVCGFPTRERFCEVARRGDHPDYEGGRPLHCLLMSGGEGSGNLLKYALNLLEHVDCTCTIICGRNRRLRAKLEETLWPRYGERARIYGFMENVQDYMAQSDLVIARGSPNTLMEAVVLNVPILITGCLPGQEADNPALMVSHNLAALCETPESAPAIVNSLMREDGKRLREMRAAQREYRNLDNARNIAKILYDMTVPLSLTMPVYHTITVPVKPSQAARAHKQQRRSDPW